MTAAVLDTALCRLVGVRYPIIQTAMGWVAYPQLVAATANAGGLGLLAAATMSLDELGRAIDQVTSQTSAPFGVNFRSDQVGVEAVVELIVERGVRVASFAGAPREDLVRRLKDAGLVTIATIGARRHAQKAEGWGVDLLIAQGAEGGGHTGAVPTSLLVPQVVDTVQIPVVAAGGFRDGRGLVAALAYGAAGIAMGTRFLLTRDSPVPERIKQIYLKTDVAGTVVTDRIDGAPQRVIVNRFVERILGGSRVLGLARGARSVLRLRRTTGSSLLDLAREGLAMRRAGGLSWTQLLMAANAPMLTRAALVEGNPRGVLPSGQVVGLIDDLPSCDELIQQIIREAEETLARLAA